MKLVRNYKITILVTTLCFLTGLIYTFITPKIYVSKSQIVLQRIKIEMPDYSSDEARNRWIWVRDGLNLKTSILTDDELYNFFQENDEAKLIIDPSSNQEVIINQLKNMINIQFTGGDENNFLTEVKAPSPKLASELNLFVTKRIRYLAVTFEDKLFNEVIEELKKKQEELKSDMTNFSFYEEKIRKLTFNHTLLQRQREKAFQVIVAPRLNHSPIWPKKTLILIVSFFIGTFIGLALEAIVKDIKRKM